MLYVGLLKNYLVLCNIIVIKIILILDHFLEYHEMKINP